VNHIYAHRCTPRGSGVKVPPVPAYLGTVSHRGRLCHLYADETLLPVIAGGSMTAVEVEKPSLLTVPEFAAEIRVAPSTAWAMVAAGEIESIIVGRKSQRIARAALDEYIASLRAEARA
jgi:excisionase family DNA binding protein